MPNITTNHAITYTNLTQFYSVLGVVCFKPCKENQNEIKRCEEKKLKNNLVSAPGY